MFLKKTMDELQRRSPTEFKSGNKFPVSLILDNIRSMNNVGSVFRTADAFAIEMICLCGHTPRPPHRDIHKTALGAENTVKWKYFSDAIIAIREFRSQGVQILAVEQTHGSLPLQKWKWNGDPMALVVGNEVTGVADHLLSEVGGVVEIPQWGVKHSLNISVATGIALWHFIGTFEGNE